MVWPMKKLAPKVYGPFCILVKIGKCAYRLKLQSSWRIHNVFHNSLLEPYRKNAIIGWSQILPKPEEIEGEKEYEVERILQSEVHTTCWKIGRRYEFCKSLYFLVQWKDYPDDKSTWKPGTSLEHVSESIEEFYGQNHDVPAITT
jgi:hypothetical protein